jgi:hypothetical protein
MRLAMMKTHAAFRRARITGSSLSWRRSSRLLASNHAQPCSTTQRTEPSPLIALRSNVRLAYPADAGLDAVLQAEPTVGQQPGPRAARLGRPGRGPGSVRAGSSASREAARTGASAGALGKRESGRAWPVVGPGNDIAGWQHDGRMMERSARPAKAALALIRKSFPMAESVAPAGPPERGRSRHAEPDHRSFGRHRR